MKSDKYMNLSYLLVLNLIFFVKGSGSGAGIYSRLNGIAVCYSLTMAMTGEKRGTKKGEKLKENLNLINDLIQLKRVSYQASYEPTHEHAEYTAEERAAFEAELYEIFTELLIITEEEGLISQEAIGEAWASSYSVEGTK